ncbi:MAG: T9SS type A sorting domain-containing protein [Bacteroidota bacterium]|nr:T9SS type A sorting domain-containing protein [Bacteroidota bacterium]
MNYMKTLMIAALLGLTLTTSAFADGKRHGKGPGHGDDQAGNFKNHFGLSDSCWNVFLAAVAAQDTTHDSTSVNVTLIDSSFDANTATIDSLRNLLDSLQDHKGRRADSVKAQISGIMMQIKGLVRVNDSLKRLTVELIEDNKALFDTTMQNCGRIVRDSGKGHDNDNDSTDVGDTTHVHGPHHALIVGRISPNPSSVGGTLNIDITLAADADVTLTVSTLLGTPVKTVDLGTVTAGSHTETLDLSGISAGSYLLSISIGTQTESRMIKIK